MLMIGRPTSASVVRPGAAYTGDVEIRVHGVSGTPPEELLDRTAAERVSGDRIAGFYRPAAPDQRRDVPRGADSDSGSRDAVEKAPWLEGYSWGGWTSGAKSRALWLVLAPFALVNVAPRMLPPDRGDPTAPPPRRSIRLTVAGLIRILAASLTITLVLGVAAPSLTTVARRCIAGATTANPCSGLPKVVTDLLARLTPAAAMGLLTVVPLALVGVLWLLSRSSAHRYETGAMRPRDGRPDDEAMPLTRPDLWHVGVAGRRLRVLHVQLGVLTVTSVLAWLFPQSGLRTAAVVVGAAGLVAAAGLAAVRLAADRDEPRRSRITGGVPLLWLGVAASVLLDVALVLAGPRVGADAAGLAPDRLVVAADDLVGGLFKGQAVLLAVIGVLLVVARMRGDGRGRDMFMNGFAGFFIALLAWLLGSMMTAAVLILAPAWLGSDGFVLTPARIADVLAEHPTWFGGTTRSSGIGMLVGVGTTLALLIQLGVRYAYRSRTGGSAADRAGVRGDYRPALSDLTAGERRDVDQRVRQIGFLRWTARLVDRVPRGIVVFCLVVIGFLMVQGIALLVPSGSRPAALAFVLGQDRQACDATAGACEQLGTGPVAWGAYLTAALLVGLLLVGVLAYRTAAMRRGVGVLWDLACFWPRDAHPFAPPCYNERIMPEVSTRIGFYVRSADAPGRVVIAGHSQGSVISMTAALIQEQEVRTRIGLVTFGCVLDRLYSRFFPRYFSPTVYAEVARRLTGPDGAVRWTNLWRATDYLGGAVPYPPGGVLTPGPLSVQCTDPRFERRAGDVVYPVAGRHSAFWLDPRFQAEIRAAFGRMPVGSMNTTSADATYDGVDGDGRVVVPTGDPDRTASDAPRPGARTSAS